VGSSASLACLQIPRLEVACVHTHDGSKQFIDAQLSASKGAAAALMHGRRLAGVDSGLCGVFQQDGEWPWPVYLGGMLLPWPEQRAQAFEAVQPLLSQLPFIQLIVGYSELNPLAVVAMAGGSLGATATKLRLVFLSDHYSYRPGNLVTVAGWLELLDALPRVKTVQITFWHDYTRLEGVFPVLRAAGNSMAAWFMSAVDPVMTPAISACEQKGRCVHSEL
jgi:hypothetical protein